MESEELDFVQEHKKMPVTLDLTPCDNAISRQEAIEAFQIFREYESNRSHKEWVDRIETVLNQLPPVTPQYEDIAKAFQLGLAFGFGETYDEMDRVMEELKKVCASQTKTDWIPISERLPIGDAYTGPRVWQKKVLITGYLSFDDTKELFVSEAFAKDVIFNRVPDTVVIAWMPLPKPYEPQKSEVV